MDNLGRSVIMKDEPKEEKALKEATTFESHIRQFSHHNEILYEVLTKLDNIMIRLEGEEGAESKKSTDRLEPDGLINTMNFHLETYHNLVEEAQRITEKFEKLA